MKTIISHFYNEEYLLPWWLKHHKKFFDHGIMIDYHSTDNSVALIKEYCPNWEIVKTKNKYFDSADIDREVEMYEGSVDGWRVTLNTTEFLVGNFAILDSIEKKDKQQLFLRNYVFVDINYSKLNNNAPLYEQIKFGYPANGSSAMNKVHLGFRPNRSIHNTRIRYPQQGGRHFKEYHTINDLVIFYYAYLLGIPEMVLRKTQIQNKMSKVEFNRFKSGHPNIVTDDTFKRKIMKYQYPLSRNLSAEIDALVNLQNNYEQTKNNYIGTSL